MKLKSFIALVRKCSNEDEEIRLIAKECAAIRDQLHKDAKLNRLRCVATLLYITTVGYPMAFAGMECLRLAASTNYSEKRLGYLAIPVFLDDKSETLMLLTNTIKKDIGSRDPNIAKPALQCLANVGQGDMLHSMMEELGQLMGSPDILVRRKATMVLRRALSRESLSDDIISKALMTSSGDRSHSSLLISLSTIKRYFLAQAKLPLIDKNAYISGLYYWQIDLVKSSPMLKRVGNSTAADESVYVNRQQMAGSASLVEYDFSGIADPFLQCAILELWEVIITTSEDCIDEQRVDKFCDILDSTLHKTDQPGNCALALIYQSLRLTFAIVKKYGQPRTSQKRGFGKLNSLESAAFYWIEYLLNQRSYTLRDVALRIIRFAMPLPKNKVPNLRRTLLENLREFDVRSQVTVVDLLFRLADQAVAAKLKREMFSFLRDLTGKSPLYGDFAGGPNELLQNCYNTDISKLQNYEKRHRDGLISKICLHVSTTTSTGLFIQLFEGVKTSDIDPNEKAHSYLNIAAVGGSVISQELLSKIANEILAIGVSINTDSEDMNNYLNNARDRGAVAQVIFMVLQGRSGALETSPSGISSPKSFDLEFSIQANTKNESNLVRLMESVTTNCRPEALGPGLHVVPNVLEHNRILGGITGSIGGNSMKSPGLFFEEEMLTYHTDREASIHPDSQNKSKSLLWNSIATNNPDHDRVYGSLIAACPGISECKSKGSEAFVQSVLALDRYTLSFELKQRFQESRIMIENIHPISNKPTAPRATSVESLPLLF